MAHRAAALGFRGDVNNPVRSGFLDELATAPLMSLPCPPGLAQGRRWGIYLSRQLGRGRRGEEKSFLVSTLFGAQRLPQPGILLFQTIDGHLLFKTDGTEVDRHRQSLKRMICSCACEARRINSLSVL
jgi:hypothetical protein